LSSKHPIAYIDIRTFAHATEDTEKVQTAIHNIFPTETINTITFEKSNLNGHHGNPITLLQTRIKDQNTIQTFIQKLSTSLSILDKQLLNDEITQHLDKATLYLRIDKQAAYQNQLELNTTDTIHIKIHFKNSNPKEIIETLKKLGILP
jgi:RNA binding exosome subunit